MAMAAKIPRPLPSSFNRLFFLTPSLRVNSNFSSSFSTLIALLRPSYHHPPIITKIPAFLSSSLLPRRTFSSSSSSSSSSSNSTTNTTASFDWSSDEDDDVDGENKKRNKSHEIDKSKLPPPYDPFSKKPVVEEPRDPSNLQEIFHKMRTEGLTNYAIKMFDALSKDGLTHEALELFAVIKDKGAMPDVVAHTAVIEAYANAGGHSKDAVRTYDRMLASGVVPNAYTFTVLIKGLAKDGKLNEASKYMLDMIARGMRPNVGTYLAVFEAYIREQKLDDARALLDDLKTKGFVLDENAVRESLTKRGHMFRSIMSLLFSK
ncbi:uncharacterized protein [Typha angustifolia]|uniref:uncharacterized protein n=1 Tax=Typha angustifolia TaxID=59011 RepID=UPI003C2ABC4D